MGLREMCAGNLYHITGHRVETYDRTQVTHSKSKTARSTFKDLLMILL